MTLFNDDYFFYILWVDFWVFFIGFFYYSIWNGKFYLLWFNNFLLGFLRETDLFFGGVYIWQWSPNCVSPKYFQSCQNFSFKTDKTFLFQTVKIFLFQTVKIFPFKMVKFFLFQTVKILIFQTVWKKKLVDTTKVHIQSFRKSYQKFNLKKHS